MHKVVRDILRILDGDTYPHRDYLPWRKTNDPYKILVSEIMLQQTQVERVVPFYRAFLKKFPTAQALARAKLVDVLRVWQGLGYNRRARYLHDAAKMISADFGGRFPREAAAIETLPGVGHYTARAVAAFAFNSREVFVETNIRTVIFHHYAHGATKLNDRELLPIVADVLAHAGTEPRDLYARWMDYGAYLKKCGVRLNHKSAHYTKQTTFEGSTRQLRAAILRELLKKPATSAQLSHSLKRKKEDIDRELTDLQKDGLVIHTRNRFCIHGDQ